MLIERSINANLIVYVDVIITKQNTNTKFELSLRNKLKSRKIREFVYAIILSCILMSSTLYC